MKSPTPPHAAAVFAIVLASTVAIVWGGRSPPPATGRVPVDSLPWSALSLHGGPLASDPLPRVVLYIAPSCPHCERSATTFAREIMRYRVYGLIVSSESEDATRAYQRRLHLPLIALDSARAFGKSARIRFVPSMIWVDRDGVATTVLAADPKSVARHIAAAR